MGIYYENRSEIMMSLYISELISIGKALLIDTQRMISFLEQGV